MKTVFGTTLEGYTQEPFLDEAGWLDVAASREELPETRSCFGHRATRSKRTAAWACLKGNLGKAIVKTSALRAGQAT